jgi:uncharacterized protein (DUF2147 family)
MFRELFAADKKAVLLDGSRRMTGALQADGGIVLPNNVAYRHKLADGTSAASLHRNANNAIIVGEWDNANQQHAFLCVGTGGIAYVRVPGTSYEIYHKGNVRKLLWGPGTWASSYIDVPGLTNYYEYEITFSNTDARAIVYRGGSLLLGGWNMNPNASPEALSFACTYSGIRLTMAYATRMTHIPSGGHGAASSLTVTNIYGIR